MKKQLHTMSAVELVLWMQTHDAKPTFEVVDGYNVTILSALPVSPREVELELQCGDQPPHMIRVRYELEVTFKAPVLSPITVH